MTISSNLRKAGPFSGNGATTAFPFAYKVFTTSDVVVTKSDGVTETTLTLTTDYTVALNPDQNANPGGTVTYPASGSPLPVGQTLTLSSSIPELQQTSITTQGGFYPKIIEDALDRLTILVQQLREIMGRSLRFPVSDPTLNITLPTAAQRANKVLGFDGNGGVATYSASSAVTDAGSVNYVPVSGPTAGISVTVQAWLDRLLTAGASLGAALVGYLQAGVGAVSRTVQDKLRERVSVDDFGAVGDGVTNDTPAFQAGITAGYRSFNLTPGKNYYLATPVQCPDGVAYYGKNGSMNLFTAGVSRITAATTAFGRNSAIVGTTQFSGFTCKGVLFTNGTNPIDLGLTHGINIENCSFDGFTGWAIAMTRGERHYFKNLVFRSNVAISSGCFGLRRQDSIYAAQLAAIADGYIDRSNFQNIVMISAVAGTGINYFMDGRRISGCSFDNVTFFGGRQYGFKAEEFIIFCTFNRIAFDGFGAFNGVTATSGIEAQGISDSVFKGVIIGGNSTVTNGLICTADLTSTVFIECTFPGDNVTTFGFKFGNLPNVNPTLIHCSGAIYHGSANRQIQLRTGQIGCKWTANNIYQAPGTVINGYEGQNAIVNMMEDQNGALASTKSWAWYFASGGGAESLVGQVVLKGIQVGNGKRYYLFNPGGVTEQSIHVGNTLPEGLETATPGSLYMYYQTATSLGAVFIKVTGSGNTGWQALASRRASGNKGDAAATLTVGISDSTNLWNTPLTAARAVALSLTNAYNGAKFRIVRQGGATGASTLDVGTGPLKSLAAGQWCEVEYDGAAWFLSAFGTL